MLQAFLWMTGGCWNRLWPFAVPVGATIPTATVWPPSALKKRARTKERTEWKKELTARNRDVREREGRRCDAQRDREQDCSVSGPTHFDLGRTASIQPFTLTSTQDTRRYTHTHGTIHDWRPLKRNCCRVAKFPHFLPGFVCLFLCVSAIKNEQDFNSQTVRFYLPLSLMCVCIHSVCEYVHVCVHARGCRRVSLPDRRLCGCCDMEPTGPFGSHPHSITNNTH